MIDVKNRGGRPWLTDEQKIRRKEYLSQNLEPYIKSGLSVNKALKEAKIANSEFYKYMSEDELFGEKIRRFRNFISVLVSSALVSHLMDIARRQMGYGQPQCISKDDIDFLRWFALHSNHTMGEYGRKIIDNFFDPDEEIQKIYGLFEFSKA